MSRSLEEFKALNKFVDEIYDEAADMDISWYALACKADLSVATVYNLGHRITQYPRAATVFALAKAVGFEVALVKKKIMRRAS